MSSANTPGPITRFGIFVLIGGVTLVFILWGVLHYLADAQKSSTHHSAQPSTKPLADSTPVPPPAVDSEEAATRARLKETLSQALSVLRDPANPNKKAALDALKGTLRGADPKAAVAAIRQFLDGKEDAPTGLKFVVGQGHELSDAPTLRTFLLDQLGDISLDANLGDAAEVARAALGGPKDSADEWALSMRNLALADPDGSRAFLAGKAREMLEYKPWQQSVSGGYLEAFDVVAYSGDASLVQDLGAMMSSPSGALQRASRVALQRMSGLAPEQVAGYLLANPSALSDYPLVRADYMGNLDLSSPNQLAQAETYLGRTDITDEEKSKFIGRLGLPAGFVSNTLVTPETIPTMPIMERRALVNQTASNWLASGKYPTLQTALQSVADFTKDAPTP